MERTAETGAQQVARAIRSGQLSEGAQQLTVSLRFLEGLYSAMASQAEGADELLYQVGFGWGAAWRDALTTQLHQANWKWDDVELGALMQLLEDDFHRAGWGRLRFDLLRERARGLMMGSLEGGIVSRLPDDCANGMMMLVAGFLASVFSALSGLSMGALGGYYPQQDCPGTLVIAHEDNVVRIWEALGRNASWEQAIQSSS